MDFMNQLERLKLKEAMADSTMRTYHLLMNIAIEKIKCLTTAKKYAKYGKDTYSILQDIKCEINRLNEMNKTVTMQMNQAADSEIIALVKFSELKKMYNTGHIDRRTYLANLKKLKTETKVAV